MGWLIRHRTTALVVAVLVGLGLAVLIVRGQVVSTGAQSEAQRFAGNLAALCRSDEVDARAVGTDCDRAVQVARDGVDGAEGIPGRGVLGTEINPAGRLVVTYSDGSVADVGRVVGTNGVDGEPGEVGPEGRGVAGTTLTGGRLMVTFTDGEVIDLGPVVGPEGRGIATLDGSTGRLLVTLTDGTEIDAGPLPSGPPGVQGDRGERGEPAPSVEYQEFRFPDGTVTRCPRSGGPDTAPVFACERSAPTPPPDGPDPGTPPATTGPVPEPPLIGG